MPGAASYWYNSTCIALTIQTYWIGERRAGNNASFSGDLFLHSLTHISCVLALTLSTFYTIFMLLTEVYLTHAKLVDIYSLNLARHPAPHGVCLVVMMRFLLLQVAAAPKTRISYGAFETGDEEKMMKRDDQCKIMK